MPIARPYLWMGAISLSAAAATGLWQAGYDMGQRHAAKAAPEIRYIPAPAVDCPPPPKPAIPMGPSLPMTGNKRWGVQ